MRHGKRLSKAGVHHHLKGWICPDMLDVGFAAPRGKQELFRHCDVRAWAATWMERDRRRECNDPSHAPPQHKQRIANSGRILTIICLALPCNTTHSDHVYMVNQGVPAGN
jgi:hypothetical protein